MDLSEYQEQAWPFADWPGHDNNTWSTLAYPTIGLTGEAGELANKVKKIKRDDGGTLTPERREAILKELGGVLWYAAAVATKLQADLSIVAERNLQELTDRVHRDVLHGDGDDR